MSCISCMMALASKAEATGLESKSGAKGRPIFMLMV